MISNTASAAGAAVAGATTAAGAAKAGAAAAGAAFSAALAASSSALAAPELWRKLPMMKEEAQKSVKPATTMAMTILSLDQMEDSGEEDE